MNDYMRMLERGKDAVAQTRCDRRTLCTLLRYFERSHPIASVSHLIRLTLEFAEQAILSEHSDFQVDTVGEAEEILRRRFDTDLNPARKNLSLFKRQLEIEDAVLEGRSPDSIFTPPRTKRSPRNTHTQELQDYLDGLKPKDLRELNGMESLEGAISRRNQEDAEVKDALKHPPKESKSE